MTTATASRPRLGDCRKVNPDAIRDLVSRQWPNYCDGAGRPSILMDTIPALCNEVDRLRAIVARVSALAADSEAVDAQAIRDAVDAPFTPVKIDFGV